MFKIYNLNTEMKFVSRAGNNHDNIIKEQK